jgi:hypothetical protein
MKCRCNQLPRSPHRFDSIYDVSGKYKKLQNTPSMITIHNGLYQGQFD